MPQASSTSRGQGWGKSLQGWVGVGGWHTLGHRAKVPWHQHASAARLLLVAKLHPKPVQQGSSTALEIMAGGQAEYCAATHPLPNLMHTSVSTRAMASASQANVPSLQGTGSQQEKRAWRIEGFIAATGGASKPWPLCSRCLAPEQPQPHFVKGFDEPS